MNEPLISVIVPIYKVEQYLDRCVQSIVDQTYKNLEIILVDDGSPDNCPEMCDAWAQKDKRIKVIHKQNGGLSDARNAGMKIASGQYMAFIDGDDYIAPEMYQLLSECILNDNSDIAACGIEMVFEDGTAPRPLTPKGRFVLERDAAMQAVIREFPLKQPVWYKLYKADLIRNIYFPVGKYHEDVFWTWQAIAQAKKVSVFDTPCYYYVQRSGSIMAERYSLRRLDAIEAKQQRLTFLKQEFPHLAEQAKKDLLFSCIYHGQLALRDLEGADLKRVFSKLKETIKECSDRYERVPIMQKLWIALAKCNLKLCCKIRNRLGVGF